MTTPTQTVSRAHWRKLMWNKVVCVLMATLFNQIGLWSGRWERFLNIRAVAAPSTPGPVRPRPRPNLSRCTIITTSKAVSPHFPICLISTHFKARAFPISSISSQFKAGVLPELVHLISTHCQGLHELLHHHIWIHYQALLMLLCQLNNQFQPQPRNHLNTTSKLNTHSILMFSVSF